MIHKKVNIHVNHKISLHKDTSALLDCCQIMCSTEDELQKKPQNRYGIVISVITKLYQLHCFRESKTKYCAGVEVFQTVDETGDTKKKYVHKSFKKMQEICIFIHTVHEHKTGSTYLSFLGNKHL